MPAIIRIGDPVSCGDEMDQGSANVFAVNLPVSRVNTDKTKGHPAHDPVPVICGSPNVFVNNIPVDRVGDPIGAHGRAPMAAGASTVFVNNQGASSIIIDAVTATIYVESALSQFSAFIQPGESLYTAMIHETDDEGAPAVGGGEVPFTHKQQTVAASAVVEGVDIKTAETHSADAATGGVPNATMQPNTDDITAESAFPGTFQLSPSFTLDDLTTNTVVSNYPLKAQHGLTEQQIVANLRALCYNVLEPLKQMYPSIRVNSGFRHATPGGKSQHEKGQAADVSLASASSNSSAWPVAQEIANSSLPYDQFIYEQNRTIWFHLSYNPSGVERRMVMTKSRSQAKPTEGLRQVM